MSEPSLDPAPSRLTFIQWLVCAIAAHRLCVRHLRTADAAADHPAGADGVGRHPARHARVHHVVQSAVLRAGRGGRAVRPAGRLSDGSLGTAARADLEYSAVCLLRVCRRFLDQLADAAGVPLPGVHRRLRRVRGGGGLAGRTVSRSPAAGGGAGIHSGVFLRRRADGGAGQRHRRGLGGEQAGAAAAGAPPARAAVARHPVARIPELSRTNREPACRLALHADVRADSGDSADRDSAVPARVACLAEETPGRHLEAAEHRRVVLAPIAQDHDHHHADVHLQLCRRVRGHPADAADRSRPAGGESRSRRRVGRETAGGQAGRS